MALRIVDSVACVACALLVTSRAGADELPPPPPSPSALPALSQTTSSAPLPPAPEVASVDSNDEPVVLLEIGTRFAYAFATGDYDEHASVGSPPVERLLPTLDAALPFTAEVGARIDRVAYVGLAYQYAPLLAGCPGGATPGAGETLRCIAYDIRVSLQARVHAAPHRPIDPWLGVGIGYEWLSTVIDDSNPAAGASLRSAQVFRGWNVLDLSAGLDIHATPSLIIGPYVEVTSGVYTNDSGRPQNGIFDILFGDSIGATSSHQWFAIGVRGSFLVGAREN